MNAMLKRIGFAEVLLIVSLLLIGAFYEYISCLMSVVMLVWLVIWVIQKKQLSVYINLTLVAVLTMVLFYLISVAWAIDSGMAFIGFMKFLPVLLYLLVLMQRKRNDEIIGILPYAAAIMTVISVIGMYLPWTEEFFSVAGRLAGFFEYPNTFALFLLIAELVAISKPKHKIIDYIIIAVLLLGLLYTGSRTVFVLAVLANIVVLFFGKNKRVKLVVAGILVLGIAAAVIYFIASGDTSGISRFMTISLSESTFVGRLLYFRDALPVILKNPFGLGYMGYYYIQQSIQTGVYSVVFIHNDILQIMLDVGWVPCMLFLAAIGRSVFNKRVSFDKKVIIVTVFLHSCFDFNMQFIAVFLILLLFMDCTSGKELVLCKHKAVLNTLSVITAAVCLYMGISLALSSLGNYKASRAMYPWNTQNDTQLLLNEKDAGAANSIAQRILTRNKYVTVAYSMRARYAYSKGDFAEVIKNKKLLVAKAPLQYEEYEEYCYMLIRGIALYNEAGDAHSAEVCEKELIAAEEAVNSMGNKLSSLGKMIDNQPTTILPQEISDYIDGLAVTEE